MFYCNNDLLELHDLTFIEEEEETCENQAQKKSMNLKYLRFLSDLNLDVDSGANSTSF